MKSPLHFYKEYYNIEGEDSEFDPNTTVSISRETLHKLMSEYALYIAKHQDKITRHAAAEIVNGITGNNNFEIAQSIISARRDIMNLQTVIKAISPAQATTEQP